MVLLGEPTQAGSILGFNHRLTLPSVLRPPRELTEIHDGGSAVHAAETTEICDAVLGP
jgi:hypothetical protein